jgi:hypothetical protein
MLTTGAGGAVCTCTLTESEPVPPVPVHVSVKVVLMVIAALAWLPVVAFAPLQPPDAVQLVAFVEDHDSVEFDPAATVVGFALRSTVGAGVAWLTVTVALRLLVPPTPLSQVSVYVVVAASGPTVWLPDVAFAPLQPPEAVQDAASVLVHVSVLDPWAATVVGLASSSIDGSGLPPVLGTLKK